MRSAADRRSITFDLTDDQGPLVLGDEDRMRQLVENLIDNAVKYADASTKVTVRASCDGHACGRSSWRIAVRRSRPMMLTGSSNHSSVRRSRARLLRVPGWACRSREGSRSCTAAP